MPDFDPIGAQTPAPGPRPDSQAPSYDPGLSGANVPSEAMRYDLSGNPLPPVGGAAPQATQPPPAPAAPVAGYGQPVAPGYGQPVAPAYAQPQPYAQPAAPGYGQPVAPAYAQPQPYAQPVAPGYGQPAAPPPPYGQPGYAPPGQPPYPPAGGYGPGAPPYAPTPHAAGVSSGPNKTLIAVGAGAGLVLLIVIAFLTVARRPAVVAAPTGFAQYTCPDQTFTVQGPSDKAWSHDDGGTPGGLGGSEIFSNGPARIEIIDSLGASVMSDIRKIPDPRNPGSYLNPAEGEHVSNKLHTARKFADYRETDFQDIASKYGTACYSEFTADGGMLTGKVHGLRVTMMGQERGISIVCQCPESSWAGLKDSFWTVINSIAPGSEVQ